MADLARAERIKALREERGLRQQDVADAIGVELRSYQRQEANGGIRGENAKKLADFYGVELKWLLMGDTPDVLGAMNGRSDERLDRIEAAVEENRRLLRRLAAAQGLDPDASAPEEAERAAEDVRRETRASHSGTAGRPGATRGRAG